jgi:glycosyltransferase involved in cell wall biosynthesis
MLFDAGLPKLRMKISVIVPVLNEQNTIGVLLDSLCSQTRPPDEIVITDGGSVDKTAQIIESYDSKGIVIRLVREREALPGRGRNVAIANALHDWLAFVDAGIKPQSDWLEHLVAGAVAEPAVSVVYGSWRPVTDSFFKECAAIAYVPPPAHTRGVDIRPRSIASCLMRRDVWRAVGGFPEHLRSAEDLLFMNEVEAAGFREVYAPGAVVFWNIQPGILGTFKRFITYSRNNMRAGLWKQWQSTIFTRYLILAVVASFAVFAGWKWLLLPLILWLALMVLRGLVAIRRNRVEYPSGVGRNLLRLFVLVPVLMVLDAAALIGTLIWLVRDRLASGREMAGAQHGA